MAKLTVEQMKAQLAAIDPSGGSSDGSIDVADFIGATAAGTVRAVSNAGTNTLDFFDRMKVGYQYQRALDTGKLNPPKAPPKSKAR